MKDLYELFIGTKHMIGVGAVIISFLLIALGQDMHEDGNKFGRIIQYVVGLLYLIFIGYLVYNVV